MPLEKDPPPAVSAPDVSLESLFTTSAHPTSSNSFPTSMGERITMGTAFEGLIQDTDAAEQQTTKAMRNLGALAQQLSVFLGALPQTSGNSPAYVPPRPATSVGAPIPMGTSSIGAGLAVPVYVVGISHISPSGGATTPGTSPSGWQYSPGETMGIPGPTGPSHEPIPAPRSSSPGPSRGVSPNEASEQLQEGFSRGHSLRGIATQILESDVGDRLAEGGLAKTFLGGMKGGKGPIASAAGALFGHGAAHTTTGTPEAPSTPPALPTEQQMSFLMPTEPAVGQQEALFGSEVGTEATMAGGEGGAAALGGGGAVAGGLGLMGTLGAVGLIAGVGDWLFNSGGNWLAGQRAENATFQSLEGGSNIGALAERARQQGFELSQWGNLTSGQADQIFQGVTALGWKGNQRQAGLDFITSMYSNLGMNIGDSLDLVSASAANGVTNLNTLSTALTSVTNTAAAASQNTDLARQNFAAMYTTAMQAGIAGVSAAAIAATNQNVITQEGLTLAGVQVGTSPSDLLGAAAYSGWNPGQLNALINTNPAAGNAAMARYRNVLASGLRNYFGPSAIGLLGTGGGKVSQRELNAFMNATGWDEAELAQQYQSLGGVVTSKTTTQGMAEYVLGLLRAGGNALDNPAKARAAILQQQAAKRRLDESPEHTAMIGGAMAGASLFGAPINLFNRVTGLNMPNFLAHWGSTLGGLTGQVTGVEEQRIGGLWHDLVNSPLVNNPIDHAIGSVGSDISGGISSAWDSIFGGGSPAPKKSAAMSMPSIERLSINAKTADVKYLLDLTDEAKQLIRVLDRNAQRHDGRMPLPGHKPYQ